MNFTVYKPGQAKLCRTTILVSGLVLALWGGQSLSDDLPLLPGADHVGHEPDDGPEGGARVRRALGLSRGSSSAKSAAAAFTTRPAAAARGAAPT